MYQKILVPLDGSQMSEAVLPSVREIAQRFGAEVILFQSVNPSLDRVAFPDENWPVIYLEQELGRVQLEAEIYLRRVARELEAEGIEVRVVIGLGGPADSILRTAEKDHADIIAMSTHGLSGLGRLLHGSVATRVLRNTIKPVVLVRPETGVLHAA